MKNAQYAALCRDIRKDVVRMITRAQSGHPGGSLSCVEILAALYFDVMNIDPAQRDRPDRDRFVLSKGHAAPAYYAVLARRGFFDAAELDTLRQYGSMLQGHPDHKRTPGVDASTGSLGQGAAVAVGMALGNKAQGRSCRTYALLGDGEMQEGIVWEALMAAAHYHLEGLTFIIDHNGLQIDGANDAVMSLGDLPGKLQAFGWHTAVVADGNDMEQVIRALRQQGAKGKPRCIIANTVKGKGVSFMEGQADWHGKAPSEAECLRALDEMGGEADG